MERPSSHEDPSAAAIEGNFVRSSLLSFPVLEEAGKRELETTGPLSGLPPPPPTLVQKQGSACKTGNVQSSFAHSKWPLLTITGFAQDGRGLGSSWKKKITGFTIYGAPRSPLMRYGFLILQRMQMLSSFQRRVHVRKGEWELDVRFKPHSP